MSFDLILVFFFISEALFCGLRLFSVVLIVVSSFVASLLLYFLMKRLILARYLAAKIGTNNGDLIR